MIREALSVGLLALLCCPAAHAAGDAFACPNPGNEAAAAAAPRDALPDTPYTRPEATVPANKRTTRGLYLTAVDAYGMVSEDPKKLLFIDVRTRGEVQFIGMPTPVDAHLPYLIEATPLQWDEAGSSFRLVVNPDFVAATDRRLAQKGLTRDAVVIVLCQGGLRAAKATDALTRAGYATVYTVIDGFEGDPVAEGPTKGLRLVNGWRNEGLPWSAKLDRAKMYGLD